MASMTLPPIAPPTASKSRRSRSRSLTRSGNSKSEKRSSRARSVSGSVRRKQRTGSNRSLGSSGKHSGKESSHVVRVTIVGLAGVTSNSSWREVLAASTVSAASIERGDDGSKPDGGAEPESVAPPDKMRAVVSISRHRTVKGVSQLSAPLARSPTENIICATTTRRTFRPASSLDVISSFDNATFSTAATSTRSPANGFTFDSDNPLPSRQFSNDTETSALPAVEVSTPKSITKGVERYTAVWSGAYDENEQDFKNILNFETDLQHFAALQKTNDEVIKVESLASSTHPPKSFDVTIALVPDVEGERIAIPFGVANLAISGKDFLTTKDKPRQPKQIDLPIISLEQTRPLFGDQEATTKVPDSLFPIIKVGEQQAHREHTEHTSENETKKKKKGGLGRFFRRGHVRTKSADDELLLMSEVDRSDVFVDYEKDSNPRLPLANDVVTIVNNNESGPPPHLRLPKTNERAAFAARYGIDSSGEAILRVEVEVLEKAALERQKAMARKPKKSLPTKSKLPSGTQENRKPPTHPKKSGKPQAQSKAANNQTNGNVSGGTSVRSSGSSGNWTPPISLADSESDEDDESSEEDNRTDASALTEDSSTDEDGTVEESVTTAGHDSLTDATTTILSRDDDSERNGTLNTEETHENSTNKSPKSYKEVDDDETTYTLSFTKASSEGSTDPSKRSEKSRTKRDRSNGVLPFQNGGLAVAAFKPNLLASTFFASATRCTDASTTLSRSADAVEIQDNTKEGDGEEDEDEDDEEESDDETFTTNSLVREGSGQPRTMKTMGQMLDEFLEPCQGPVSPSRYNGSRRLTLEQSDCETFADEDYSAAEGTLETEMTGTMTRQSFSNKSRNSKASNTSNKSQKSGASSRYDRSPSKDDGLQEAVIGTTNKDSPMPTTEAPSVTKQRDPALLLSRSKQSIGSASKRSLAQASVQSSAQFSAVASQFSIKELMPNQISMQNSGSSKAPSSEGNDGNKYDNTVETKPMIATNSNSIQPTTSESSNRQVQQNSSTGIASGNGHRSFTSGTGNSSPKGVSELALDTVETKIGSSGRSHSSKGSKKQPNLTIMSSETDYGISDVGVMAQGSESTDVMKRNRTTVTPPNGNEGSIRGNRTRYDRVDQTNQEKGERNIRVSETNNRSLMQGIRDALLCQAPTPHPEEKDLKVANNVLMNDHLPMLIEPKDNISIGDLTENTNEPDSEKRRKRLLKKYSYYNGLHCGGNDALMDDSVIDRTLYSNVPDQIKPRAFARKAVDPVHMRVTGKVPLPAAFGGDGLCMSPKPLAILERNASTVISSNPDGYNKGEDYFAEYEQYENKFRIDREIGLSSGSQTGVEITASAFDQELKEVVVLPSASSNSSHRGGSSQQSKGSRKSHANRSIGPTRPTSSPIEKVFSPLEGDA